MRKLAPYILLLLLAVSHVAALRTVTRLGSAATYEENPFYALPSPIMKIAALDYDGIVSDFLFIEGMVYIGKNLKDKGSTVTVPLNDFQWTWFSGVMNTASDLDPYFQDVYYVANSFLTWDAGMVREANALLEKGSKARSWDWVMPYFIGFNEFYFLDDNESAGRHLMEASQRPNASPMLASIAARLEFQENKLGTAILFLEDIISRTEDESLKKVYGTRLKALKNLDLLGQASTIFKKRTGRNPRTVEDLIKAGIITAMPEDPYGGHYYVEEGGSVRSTTDKDLGVYKRVIRRKETNP